ncbi:MAG: hypothetical protein QW453_05435 [Thermoprotei archaeon]
MAVILSVSVDVNAKDQSKALLGFQVGFESVDDFVGFIKKFEQQALQYGYKLKLEPVEKGVEGGQPKVVRG